MTFIRPAKVISGSVASVTEPEYWPYNTGDAYWSGGATPKPYRWTVEFTIETATHSNPNTRRKYSYDGEDIKVGDYVADSKGKVLKLISISMKTGDRIVAKVEDVNRINTFSDSSKLASGVISTGSTVVFFELTEEGNPLLNPFPESLPASAYANIVGRFDRDNPAYHYRVTNVDVSDLEEGMFVSVTDEGKFVQTTSTHNLVIGKVTDVNKAEGSFALMPSNKIMDQYNSLPGDVGDILYSVEDSVEVSTTGDVPVMVKLRNNTVSSVTSTFAGPTEPFNEISINGVPVAVGATGSSTEFINAVNAKTSIHGIVAEPVESTVGGGAVQTNTVAISNMNEAAYGEPAAFLTSSTLKAIINGVTVTFTTTVDGMAAIGDVVALGTDMVVDINAANIPNVTASYGVGIVLTNSAGGDISITNLSVDDSGFYFAGPGSCSGLPTFTAGVGGAPVETITKVKLTAPDARAITLSGSENTLLTDFGLYSVENGTKAAALLLNGSSGMKKASSVVVPSILARDALNATVGDQAMVLNKGDGEWGLYLHDGSKWIMISSQESANSDSHTVSVSITPASESGVICEVSDGALIQSVTVDVRVAFAGNADLVVSDADGQYVLIDSNVIDFSIPGKYIVTPNVTYGNGDGSDTDIVYSFSSDSTVGEIVLSITYN